MFSIKKYSVTPVRPASANSASCDFFCAFISPFPAISSARKPSANRAIMISSGVNARSSTLVETKVVPQTSSVNIASACPCRAWFAFILFTPYARFGGLFSYIK